MEMEEENYLQKTEGSKKKSVIMASNFEYGTSKIQKGITSGVGELLFMSNRLTICSNAVQNRSKKTPALPTLRGLCCIVVLTIVSL